MSCTLCERSSLDQVGECVTVIVEPVDFVSSPSGISQARPSVSAGGSLAASHFFGGARGARSLWLSGSDMLDSEGFVMDPVDQQQQEDAGVDSDETIFAGVVFYLIDFHAFQLQPHLDQLLDSVPLLMSEWRREGKLVVAA
ncbi:hypothetical protein B484DRAFT_407628 [Ochromonadaceae sp. CCMP2298]|nr:hypothetical protein B484DRAFT_407628 [Ochromonadaceae sp. CCMP2298]